MDQYAYARVSSRDQNLTRQISAFLEFGILRNRIYCDKKSGKDFERTQYTHPFAILVPTDEVHCVTAVYDEAVVIVRIRWVIVTHIILQECLPLIFFFERL